jgi:sorting nexin-1/2
MMLSGSLSTCFAGLGEVERRTCELADLQAEADARELGSVLYEYERIVGSIRVSLLAVRLDLPGSMMLT